jgi:WD40-like Beta Propeller Repeat
MTLRTIMRQLALALATVGLASCAWFERVHGPTGAISDPATTTEVWEIAISDNGRYVAYESYSDGLVDGDTNGKGDIFVRDTFADTTAIVSVATDGSLGNGHSRMPSISDDGRYVAFVSSATNFSAGDDTTSDVFIHDRTTHSTTLVSTGYDFDEFASPFAGDPETSNVLYPVISGDGSTVAWNVDARLSITAASIPTGPFVAIVGGPPKRMVGKTWAGPPSLSDDGRRVAHSSFDLPSAGFTVPYQSTVSDVATSSPVRTVDAGNLLLEGETPPSIVISGNGRHVAYSGPDNVVRRMRILTGEAVELATATSLVARVTSIADDGSRTTFRTYADRWMSLATVIRPGEVRFTGTDSIGRRSINVHSGVISGDGQWVAFIGIDPTDDKAIGGDPFDAFIRSVDRRDHGPA